MAALNVGGETIDAFSAHVTSLGPSPCILVDEIFLCEVKTLAKLCDIASLPGIQWILIGDDAQCEPVRNHWFGAEIEESAFERSDLLKLFAPVQCNLRTCHRSDQTIHDFCLRCRGDEDVDTLIAEARKLFTARGEPEWQLTLDNRLREEINSMYDPGEGIDLGGWHAQVGSRLLAQAARGGLRNNVLYRVLNLDPSVLEKWDGGGAQVTLTPRQASQWLRPSFAITINCAQGRTRLGHVRVHTGRNGLRHRFFGKRRLLTAISRATEGRLVSIA